MNIITILSHLYFQNPSFHHDTIKRRGMCVCVWGRGVLPHVPCAFHFMETLRLVEITSLLHVIVMLEEKISKSD